MLNVKMRPQWVLEKSEKKPGPEKQPIDFPERLPKPPPKTDHPTNL
jgi:hypothetical protein